MLRELMVSAAAAAAGLVVAVSGAGAGPLFPPAGAVGPTMKTLAQVEPRTPIGPEMTPGDANSVHAVTQPGSYYLTGNVVGAAGKAGIKIVASGVTIDLNGFEVVGVAGAQVGVWGTETAGRITVSNGTVRSWPQGGVRTFGADVVVKHLHLDSNGVAGLWVNQGATVLDCRMTRNSGPGVEGSGGAVMVRTEASQNTFGVLISGITRLVDCRLMNNSAGGAAISGTATVTGCAAINNGGIGFAGYGVMESCIAGNNTQDGIAWSGVINGCNAYNNARHGIYASSGSRITDNTSTGNGSGSGITDGSGIYATGDGGFLSGNRCRGNDRGSRS